MTAETSSRLSGPAGFDVQTYVEEFGASIVPAYRRGVGDTIARSEHDSRPVRTA